MKQPTFKLNKKQEKIFREAGFVVYQNKPTDSMITWTRGPLQITVFKRSNVTLKELVGWAAQQAAYAQRQLVWSKIEELKID